MLKFLNLPRALIGVLFLAASASAQLTWTQLQPSTSPAPRYGHAMYLTVPAYVPVMFGGFDGSQAFGDTWGWTGSNWQLRASTGPSPRYGHAMTMLDYHDNSLLLFGGRNAEGALNGETWTWRGNTWSQLVTPVAPSARAGHALAVDEMTGVTALLFGGRTASGLSSETWFFADDQWTLLPTATTPPAREGHALIWNALLGGILLQGGRNDAQVLSDEWHFDGVDWHPIAPTGAVARADHALTFESGLRYRYIAFGGLAGTASADTSERTTDNRWLHHETAGAPSARTRTALVSEYGRYLLFGGRDAAGQALGDTWRMQPALNASVDNFGNGCGPGPWGPVGPALLASTPLLGSSVSVRVMSGGHTPRALIAIGSEITPTPFGTCGFLIHPTRTIAMRLEEIVPGLDYGEIPLAIPFDTSLRGTTMSLQAVIRAPNGQPTPAFSQGVRLTLAD